MTFLIVKEFLYGRKMENKRVLKKMLLILFITITSILFLATLITICIEICLSDIKTNEYIMDIVMSVVERSVKVYGIVLKYFLVFCVPIVILNILFMIGTKKYKEKQINFEGYFRDINQKYTPAIASYILDDNVEDSKDILATILYLATKKYLNLDIENEIINIEITSKSNENLFQHEQYLINCIKEDKKIQAREFYRYVNEDCEKVNLIKIKKEFDEKEKIILLVGILIWAISGTVLGQILWIYGILVTILFFWLLAFITSRLDKTKEGKIYAKEIKGLKHYLKDYTLIKEKEVNYIEIGGEYLAYALALDVADKIENTQLEYNKLIDKYIE